MDLDHARMFPPTTGFGVERGQSAAQRLRKLGLFREDISVPGCLSGTLLFLNQLFVVGLECHLLWHFRVLNQTSLNETLNAISFSFIDGALIKFDQTLT